ncbi:phage holin family protein [Geminicoccaceae bacterium 1502E]|nr:phage holin family protein [Geminicoccaceae bacterium 1502E]
MEQRVQDRSVGDLLRSLADDVIRLIRDEIALARAEAGDKLHQMVMAVVSIIGGSLVAFAALLILLFALVFGLANHMPLWLAALIVGGVVAIIGMVMVKAGASALSATSLAPDRTARNLRKDMDLVKEQVS